MSRSPYRTHEQHPPPLLEDALKLALTHLRTAGRTASAKRIAAASTDERWPLLIQEKRKLSAAGGAPQLAKALNSIAMAYFVIHKRQDYRRAEAHADDAIDYLNRANADPAEHR